VTVDVSFRTTNQIKINVCNETNIESVRHRFYQEKDKERIYRRMNDHSIDRAQKATYIDIKEFTTFILDLALSPFGRKCLRTATNAIEETQNSL
jgi:hypothetical protein